MIFPFPPPYFLVGDPRVTVVFPLFAALVLLYFWPTVAAEWNRNRNVAPIFLMNLFLGWLLVGWVVALIWAYRRDQAGSYG